MYYADICGINTTLGGYYKIDMSNRKVELLGINTALYLENNMATRHNYHHDPGILNSLFEMLPLC